MMASLQKALVKARLVKNFPGLIPKERSTAVYAVIEAKDMIEFIVFAKAELLENPSRIHGIIEAAHIKFDKQNDGFEKLIAGLCRIRDVYEYRPIQNCLKFLD